jgi:short-subunit dehydrogenase
MSESLAGKIIVVTGASAGIGRALSIELVARGATVALLARSAEKLGALAEELGPRAKAIVTDVTRRGDVEAALAQTVAAFGNVDVWVNNAGRGISKNVDVLTDDDLDAMVRDNVKSALYGMQTALAHFRASAGDSGPKGQLVNVSSMLSRTPFAPFRSAYSASKAALNSLTESLRFQLAESAPGVVVTLVLPGVVATEFGNNALGGGPDSRTMPGAQPVGEVAVVIADAIEHQKREVYTHSSYPARVDGYFAGLRS